MSKLSQFKVFPLRKSAKNDDIAPWMPEADGCCQYSYVEPKVAGT